MEVNLKFLRNFSISKKLSGSLLVIATGFILFGYYSFYTLNQLKVNGPIYNEIVRGKDLIADILPPPDYIIESYLTAFELRENLQDTNTVLKLEAYLINKLKKEYYERHEYWVHDSVYLTNVPVIRREMCENSYQSANNFYEIISDKYLPAIKNKDIKAVNDLLNGQLKIIYTEHRKSIDAVVSMATDRNIQIERKAALSIKSRTIQLLVLLLASLFIGFGVFIIVLLQILSSLKLISRRFQDIADGEGDLTKRLDASGKDEIGKLSQFFNQFVDKIQVIIRKIGQNSETVATAAAELSATSTKIATNTNGMNAQTSTVASSTEQATANMKTISTAVGGMSSLVNNVAIAIDEMLISLNDVAANCQKELNIVTTASNNTSTGKEIMTSLDISAKEIGKVVDVINNIASQTNLLALNATIEAASAGDAGKGFSVVANEVKELAKKTARATQEIKKQIKTMQDNTLLAVKTIEQVGIVIEEVKTISRTIVNAVEEQNTTVNIISKNVSNVNLGTQEIVRNVSESAKGLSEIAITTSNVNMAVADTSSSISHVKSSTDDLVKLSENLNELVRQFKY
jgi:methyl-accepting chemotaxis protein